MRTYKNQVDIFVPICVILIIATLVYTFKPQITGFVSNLKFVDAHKVVSVSMEIAGVEHEFDELKELGAEDGSTVPVVLTLKNGKQIHTKARIQLTDDENITETTYKYDLETKPKWTVTVPMTE